MTSTDRPVPRTDDSPRLAADARSILACPSSVSMVVEGETRLVGADHELGLTDQHGTPTFVCTVDSPVTRAADSRRSALLTLTSGLGPRGSAERADTLTLAGRLERTGIEDCACCRETRHVVTLDLSFVLLARADRQLRVPLDQFHSPAHHLNRGHLQRSVEHANDCHQDELRQAVSLGTGTRPGDLLGVRLAGLTPSRVEIQWVDVDGAHRTVVSFPRTAGSLDELGELLRRGLHAGLC
jgi:hypothetical protein